MKARLTSGSLGFTAFLFHFAATTSSVNIPIGSIALSLSIGIGTFAVYNPSKVITAHFSPNSNGIGSNFLVPALAFLFIAPFIQSKTILQSLPLLTMSALLTAAYYRPLRIGKRIINGLRAIPLVKNMTLALAWGLATTPIMNGTAESIDLFLFRFLFVLALSIAIDIRDCEYDASRGTRTLALLIGSRYSTTIATFILLFAAGFARTQLFPSDASSSQGTIIILHTIFTALGVSLLNADSKPMTYFWLIDFQLFLHALLFLIIRIGF